MGVWLRMYCSLLYDMSQNDHLHPATTNRYYIILYNYIYKHQNMLYYSTLYVYIYVVVGQNTEPTLAARTKLSNPPGSKRQSFLGNHLQKSQVPPVRQGLNWPNGHQDSMSPRLQGTASFQTNGNKRKQSSPTHTVWAALSQCAMAHAFIINWNPGLDKSFRGNTMSS